MLSAGNPGFIYDYAPRIYLARNELYNPSSIEFFKNFTHEELIDDKTWLVTNQNLTSPSDVLPFFYGQNTAKTSVPVYALLMPGIDEQNPISAVKDPSNHDVVVSYFTFYPYNRGKVLMGTVWDNHVGDIEHLHIYFSKGIPTIVVTSYHAWNTTKNWGDPSIEFVPGTNHTILYSAIGSHGLWFNNGTHQYHKNPPLYDETSNGVCWDSWNNLQITTPYQWGPNERVIYRWGDPSTDFPNENCYFGYCRLGNGPTGMLGKTQLRKTIESLKIRGYICSDGCVWDSGIF